MAGLVAKQMRFVKAMTLLKQYADYKGYGVTQGECWRRPDDEFGHPHSTHKSRLAEDLNIFINYEYLQGDDAANAHNELHDFWDMLGGAERIAEDLNHYSFEHNGVR